MPVFTNTKESGLEALIVKWLVEQNGYEEGTNADYNKEYAVDERTVRQTKGNIAESHSGGIAEFLPITS